MSVIPGVSEPWLQAHPNDPVEPQFPYWYGRRYCATLHDTTILNSARDRHMSPRHPQQWHIPFLRCHGLCLNLNELQTCRTGDTVCIFLYMLAYVECRPLGTPECILIDAPNQGNLLLKTLALVGERWTTSRCNHLVLSLGRCKTVTNLIL